MMGDRSNRHATAREPASTVPIDPSRLRQTLIDGAALLARSGDLDERLAELLRASDDLVGAARSVVYLYDADARLLLPVAGHGVAVWESEASDGQALQVDAEDAAHPAARAVRDRRGEIAPADASAPPLTTDGTTFQALISVPLTAHGPGGSPELEGVLLAAFETQPEDPAETQVLLGAVGDIAAAVIRQARVEQLLVERSDWLERVAHTDPLTGLANRRTFDRMLELELLRSARQTTPMSLALVDIDGLATITEREGGEVGDDVLRRVASTLADTVRLVDTIARFGPDEFAVLAPGAAGAIVARRIRDAVAAIDPPGGTTVSVSVGVARFPEDGTTAEGLIEAAEGALREAKRQGAGAIVARP